MSDILKIILILVAIIVIGGLFGYKGYCDKRDKLKKLRPQPTPLQTKAVNLEFEPTPLQTRATPLQTGATPLQTGATPLQTSASRLVPEQTACDRCDDYDDFDYKSMHLISGHEQGICSQDPVLPLCPGPGTTLYGMAITDQTIYPGSYLPAAVYNTSGYSQSCSEKQGVPSPCYY